MDEKNLLEIPINLIFILVHFETFPNQQHSKSNIPILVNLKMHYSILEKKYDRTAFDRNPRLTKFGMDY